MNSNTAKSTSANTAKSSCSREANTTAAEMAAFIDNTEVSLRGEMKKEPVQLGVVNVRNERVHKPYLSRTWPPRLTEL